MRAATQENVQPNSQQEEGAKKEEPEVSKKATSVAGSAALPPRSHTSHISKRSSIKAASKVAPADLVGLGGSQADRMSQKSQPKLLNNLTEQNIN